MALELYWGSGSANAWRVLLALEFKRLPYVSHLLEFAKLEHRAPHVLRMNPRARVPILKDGEYVCFEWLAILYYLERKFPEIPLFGRTAEEAGTIMRVICEYQTYAEERIMKITSAIILQGLEQRLEEVGKSVQAIANEARTIDTRLQKAEWLVGANCSAADFTVFPGIMLLLRSFQRREAQEIRARLLPLEVNFPGIAQWVKRIEALPGYERTYPPHWREIPVAS